jgi:hypothetical protein
MSEELRTKQEHLAALEDFLQSRVFLGYKSGLQEDRRRTIASIISIDPLRFEDFVEELKLRGELRCLEQMETVFEDARSTLKARIDEMAEVELQTASNRVI